VATTRDDLVARPVTTGLGVLGMPGFTAHGSLRAIGKPRPGETVVVAAAVAAASGAASVRVTPAAPGADPTASLRSDSCHEGSRGPSARDVGRAVTGS
jgi:hypothetical protein